jgi:hypothetical protein
MARIASEKYENRRVRSFNLDDHHYRELKDIAMKEGISMSDVLNRTLVHALVKAKVAEDVKNGLQTTLEVHTQTVEQRQMRRKGSGADEDKCNPRSLEGRCAICWSVEL